MICSECKTSSKKIVPKKGAVKAGDWFCDTCPSNGRGNTKFRYYWLREVLHTCDHEAFKAHVDVNRKEKL